MVSPEYFLDILKENEVDFFSGVPDSLLKDVCLCIEERIDSNHHIIAANEGGAIGLATGYYLATRKIPLVYMQNSGIGNAVNPLTSLTDPEVYGIPMIIMIGWRGELGVPDEPQHKKMGKITLDILDTLDIPYFVLPSESSETKECLTKALDLARGDSRPVALVVKKGIFSKYAQSVSKHNCLLNLSREQALESIIKKINDSLVISTTGKLSRELFELRESSLQSHSSDFLTVGSMGHASQIALAISLSSKKKVVCLDGDGALIMHLGSLVINGQKAPENFLHVIFNNGCHESVGGQPTAGFNIDIPKIAKACGYKYSVMVESEIELEKELDKVLTMSGHVLLEVRINKESRGDLGRPTKTPKENKDAFMDFFKN